MVDAGLDVLLLAGAVDDELALLLGRVDELLGGAFTVFSLVSASAWPELPPLQPTRPSPAAAMAEPPMKPLREMLRISVPSLEDNVDARR